MGFATLSVKGRALRWLAQREHSRLELQRKLARHVQDTPETSAAAQIAQALDELAALGYLSEVRVAESVLAAQAPRAGARRLKQLLQAKGLAPELVAQSLQQMRGSELDRARALWQRRFGNSAADPREQARQVRFLAGRGFEGEIIRLVVRGLPEE